MGGRIMVDIGMLRLVVTVGSGVEEDSFYRP